jgi:hypothetical protein
MVREIADESTPRQARVAMTRALGWMTRLELAIAWTNQEVHGGNGPPDNFRKTPESRSANTKWISAAAGEFAAEGVTEASKLLQAADVSDLLSLRQRAKPLDDRLHYATLTRCHGGYQPENPAEEILRLLAQA